MVSLIKVRDSYVDPEHKEFFVDSSADIDSLTTQCAIGSLAAVIDSGEVYVLSGSGWVLFGG